MPALALLVLTVGCQDAGNVSTPTAPGLQALNVSGGWSAVLSGLDAAAANGQLAVTFDHRHLEADRGVLFGTWQLTGPDQSTRSGTVSGVVMGTVAQIDLVPAERPECPNALDTVIAGVLALNVTMTPNRLAGTVSAYTCGVKFDSTIELRR